MSCQTTSSKSGLNLDLDDVQSMNIYNIYGHFKDYGLVERDTTIAIDKKDWQPLIDNLNNVAPLDSQKSTVFYSIIIETKSEEEIKVQITSKNSFRLKDGKTYPFYKSSIDILERYYKDVPFMNQ